MVAVRILGIDPGTVLVGFGCLELGANDAARPAGAPPLGLSAANVVRRQGADAPRLVETGVLRLGGRGDAISERLCELAAGFAALLDRLHPDEIALEEAFFGKSVQSALRIGEARGVVLAEAGRRRLPVHQFAPARVKKSLTGSGNAEKETVAAMLGQLLPGAAAALRDLPADASDALAVALCRAESRQSPLVLAGLVAELDAEAERRRARRHQA